MRDLFDETMKRNQEFNEAWEKAYVAYLCEHWDEFDEMAKTTFRYLYADRVPKLSPKDPA